MFLLHNKVFSGSCEIVYTDFSIRGNLKQVPRSNRIKQFRQIMFSCFALLRQNCSHIQPYQGSIPPETAQIRVFFFIRN